MGDDGKITAMRAPAKGAQNPACTQFAAEPVDGDFLQREEVGVVEAQLDLARKAYQREKAAAKTYLRGALDLLTPEYEHQDQAKELAAWRKRGIAAESEWRALSDRYRFWLRLWAVVAVIGWILLLAEALKRG